MRFADNDLSFLASPRNTASRAKVVEDWAQDGGVLLMGYEMYRLLSLKKSFVAGRKKKGKKTTGPVVMDLDEEDRQQELLKGKESLGRRNKEKCSNALLSNAPVQKVLDQIFSHVLLLQVSSEPWPGPVRTW